MKLCINYKAVLILALFGVIGPLYAQKNYNNRPDPKTFNVGLRGYSTISFTDVKYSNFLPNTAHGELGYGGALQLSKYLNPKFGVLLDIGFSNLYGYENIDSLNYKFSSHLQSASLQTQLNVLQLFNSNPSLNKWSLWLDLGLGWARWQAILNNKSTGDTVNNLNWGTNKYKSAAVLPLGLHLKYYFGKKWSVDAYAQTVFLNSDLLDAKEDGFAYDYFLQAGIGIQYHFLIQRNIRKVPNQYKADNNEIQLLDYMSIDPFSDPEIERISKKEIIEKEEIKAQELISNGNPFNFELNVPENAGNKGFQILVSIKKRGITGNGYFRLSLPSGFYPIPPNIKEVSYTRISYQYDFDFYLPMNLDTLNIPIDITISEREDGTYPIFVEGEIMNSDGQIFPIRQAQYVQIGEKTSQPTLESNVTKPAQSVIAIKEKKTAKTPVIDKDSQKNEYQNLGKYFGIQIMACRKPSQKVNQFLADHYIDQEVYSYEKGGWYKYNIFLEETRLEAENKLRIVQSEHQINDAFIVEFNYEEAIVFQAKRGLLTQIPGITPTHSSEYIDNQFSTENSSSLLIKNNNAKTNSKPITDSKPIEKLPQFEIVSNKENISVYRVEIAISPANPIPLRQLQNWVANEKITEWTYQSKYRYTIGEFENEQVAHAFLKYVRMQFALPDAHLVETKGQDWLRVVR